jgi:hypothetical protein
VTATAVAGGNDYSYALGNNGKVYAWGFGGQAQRGDGTTTTFTTTPGLVSLPSGVTATAIAAGKDHGLALTSNGAVYAWGYNAWGQVGDGTTSQRNTPVVVSGVTATAIAVGANHSLALASNGTVYAWGNNSNGQVGDNSTTNRFTPVAVSLPGGVTATAIAGGSAHSLALGSNGTLYAWGANSNRQVGDGTTTQRLTPVVVQLPSANTAPTISDIPDQTANEDTPTSALSFTIGDAETAAGSLTVSGSSSNTTLVPNTNIVFGGSGANRTVTVTPAANQSGTATITVTVSDGSLTASDTFVLTVNAVNDAPVANADEVTTNEDTAVTIAVLGNDTDVEGDSPTVATVAQPAMGTVVINPGNKTVTYTPATNYNGADAFIYTVTDGQVTSGATVTVTLTAVNDAPSFVKGADQTVLEDAGGQTVTGWATGIGAGPSDESGQMLTFLVTNNNTALFSVQPAVSTGNGGAQWATDAAGGGASSSGVDRDGWGDPDTGHASLHHNRRECERSTRCAG